MSQDEFLRIEKSRRRRFGRIHTPSKKDNHRPGPQDLHFEIRRERHYREQVSFRNEANSEWIRVKTYANITSQVARRLQINPMIESIPNLRYLSLVLRRCCKWIVQYAYLKLLLFAIECHLSFISGHMPSNICIWRCFCNLVGKLQVSNRTHWDLIIHCEYRFKNSISLSRQKTRFVSIDKRW